MLGAVRDCVPMLHKAKHELNKGSMLNNFKDAVMSEIKEVRILKFSYID